MNNETTASQPMQELVRDLYNFEGGRHFALRLEKMLASQPPIMVAEPVGEMQTITINGRQLQDALDAAWPDRADKDQGDTEITLFMRPAPGVDGEGDLLPGGLYLYWTEYPDEGCSWLNPDSDLASAAQLADSTDPAAPMVADPAGVADGNVRSVLQEVVAFWDSITMEDCVNDIHVKARAALAATVKAVPKIRITLHQARLLVDFFGGHDADVTVTERPVVWEQVEEGLYAFCTEYPEDGAQFLGATEVDDELMRLGTVKAVPSEARDEPLAKEGDSVAGRVFTQRLNRHSATIYNALKAAGQPVGKLIPAAPLADKTGGGE